MRRRATRLLHVLACAPVAALLAATSAPVRHALAAEQPRPQPVVVAVDAGHGGSPDNSRPDQPYDPGVISAGGLQEKDVTLDVARRLERLLRAESVKVVMTRTDDRYVGIPERMDAAEAAHAEVFVSIHFNSFTDPTTGGALVLYPNDASQAFAAVMSQTLARGLTSFGIANDGVQAHPDLWQHAAMPAVTVEGAYLTNPREADLCAQPAFRQALAQAILAGVEAQDPVVEQRRAQIGAWDAAHATQLTVTGPDGAPAGAPGRATGGAGGGLPAGPILALVLAGTLVVALRRRALPVPAVAHAALGATSGRLHARRRGRHETRRADPWRGGDPFWAAVPMTVATGLRRRTAAVHRARMSRRTREARRRDLIERSRHPQRRRSVYDELSF